MILNLVPTYDVGRMADPQITREGVNIIKLLNVFYFSS